MSFIFVLWLLFWPSKVKTSKVLTTAGKVMLLDWVGYRHLGFGTKIVRGISFVEESSVPLDPLSF